MSKHLINISTQAVCVFQYPIQTKDISKFPQNCWLCIDEDVSRSDSKVSFCKSTKQTWSLAYAGSKWQPINWLYWYILDQPRLIRKTCIYMIFFCRTREKILFHSYDKGQISHSLHNTMLWPQNTFYHSKTIGFSTVVNLLESSPGEASPVKHQSH